MKVSGRCLKIFERFLEWNWMVSGRRVKYSGKVSDKCLEGVRNSLEGVWKVSGRCLEDS